MALGPNLTTVIITGKYVDFEGNPIAGQIRFNLQEVLRNGTDDQLVAPSSIVIPLVNGTFSVSVPATNDPDVVPNPFTYELEESFTGGRTYPISIPYSTVGSLDLADISPDPSISTTYISLIDQNTFNVLSGQITTLDTSIDQVNNTILASGKYWYIPASFSTYSALDAAYSTYTSLTSAIYGLTGADIAGYTTSASASATSASSSLTLAQNNAAGTISPLLLIGG